MGLEQVKILLKQKENIRLEFKKARNKLPSNIFESICAMLNRDGGDILIGISDNGELIGVDTENVDEIVSQVVNQSNNQQKLDPQFILFPQVFDIDGKTIIRIQIPGSSQIHKTGNVVYDRSNDGDFKIIEDLRSKLRRIFDPLSNFFIARLPRSKRRGTELASSAKPMRSRGFNPKELLPCLIENGPILLNLLHTMPFALRT